MTSEQDTVSLPIVYVGLEEVETLFANNFVIQHQVNEFILTVSQIQPPILLGTDSERKEQAERLSYIPAKVVSGVAFNRDRLVSLISIVQENLAAHDALSSEAEE